MTTTPTPRRAAGTVAPVPAAPRRPAAPRGKVAPPPRLAPPGRDAGGTSAGLPGAPVTGRPAPLTSSPPRLSVPHGAAAGTPDPARTGVLDEAAPALSRVRPQVPPRSVPDADNALRGGSTAAPWWPQPPAGQDVYVRLTLDLEPVPKDRHRTSAAEYTRIGGQRVKTKAAHSYTPQRLEEYETKVGWLLRQAKVRRNDTDDLGVHAVFHVRGNQPDLDNLVKSLFDACNGVAWHDDKQVTCLTTGLVRGSDRPRTELVIYVAALAGLNAGTTC